MKPSPQKNKILNCKIFNFTECSGCNLHWLSGKQEISIVCFLFIAFLTDKFQVILQSVTFVKYSKIFKRVIKFLSEMNKSGKNAPPKKKGKGIDPSQGIMQGIQSIHGWMSAQTKITPRATTHSKKIIVESSEEVRNNYSYSVLTYHIIGRRHGCDHNPHIRKPTEVAQC